MDRNEQQRVYWLNKLQAKDFRNPVTIEGVLLICGIFKIIRYYNTIFDAKLAPNLIVQNSTTKSAFSAPLQKMDANKVPKMCCHKKAQMLSWAVSSCMKTLWKHNVAFLVHV